MPRAEPDRKLTPNYWRGRLFKNSYTRAGRVFQVKAWSVKIQRQGRRRTFTFATGDKDAAARRALAIYRTVSRAGWPALAAGRASRAARVPEGESGDGREMPKTDLRFWRARLTARKYPPPPGDIPEAILSANIAHDGLKIWFPLGTHVAEPAAQQALEIYSTVVAKGWRAACRRYSREVSLAIHWNANPMAWTYTTLHTAVAGGGSSPPPRRDAPPPKSRLDVALIEPEECLRRALAQAIETEPGTLCVAGYASPREALRDSLPPKQTLWLVNRDLPAMGGAECLEKLKARLPGLCGLIYSTHDDSEQLFAASPGGAGAYLFNRTPPGKILEPLLNAPAGEALSMTGINLLVRQYFQRVTSSVLPEETMRCLGTLTQREHEILQSLGRGYLDKEIAAKLGISTWTVHGHVKKIFRKLRVHTRTEAVIQYLQR